MIEISKESSLLSFIKIYRNAIPVNDCDLILKELAEYNIVNYNWYDPENFDNNVDRTGLPIKTRVILYNHTIQNLDHYSRTIAKNKYSNLSPVYINKYSSGDYIPKHVDNNNLLFKDIFSGVPVLTLIGVLNDTFIGGDVIMWNDHSIKLKKGDIMIFPSNFLYPHQIAVITSGFRYSFIRWAY